MSASLKRVANARQWLAIAVTVVICDCAAIGVPETSDPDKKLQYAHSLFNQQLRPLPAEELIREAIDIYKQRNDDLGLAEAYRAYGFLFRSNAVEKYHKHYKENGFLEDGATYANRYDESIKYFRKSAALFEQHHEQDALTNVYLNMGFTHEFAGRKDKACSVYRKSLESNVLNLKSHPGAKIALPEGYESYGQYVGEHMARLHCQEL